MKWSDIQYFKIHSRIDYDCEDALLELYGNAAEETILNTINRTYENLIEEFGEVPVPIRQATLMLVDLSYTQRSPVSTVNINQIPYSFDILIKPYIKLTCDPCMFYDTVTLGSDFKIDVTSEIPGGLSMRDVDFDITVYNLNDKKNKKEFKKEDCIPTDDSGYIVLLNSDDLGVGIVMVSVDFKIPDTDFPDGFRKEIVRKNPRIRIKG